MARGDAEMRIRLPADVKDWLISEARKNVRTQNAQITFSLREVMAAGHDLGGHSPATEETIQNARAAE